MVPVSIDPARADRRISGEGTDETSWRDWAGWATPPEPVEAFVTARLVVVAPHPDDEVLGAGGLMWAAAQQEYPVLVVAVTDGDGSHPNSTRWPVEVLRAQRRFERANALAQLGISDFSTVRGGVPDGAITAHIDQVAELVAALVADGDTVVTPWQWDGHPDHEACATAVQQAVAGRAVQTLQTPIWGWHWATPTQFPAPARLFALGSEARLAKERAVAEYRSQLEPDPSTGAEPILPTWALARLIRDVEVYFDA